MSTAFGQETRRSDDNPAAAIRPAPGSIPKQPGCYLFSDAEGRVLYVGKAKDLSARLASYFAPWRSIPARTRPMLEQAGKLDWIVVGSETDALHLEWNLIQQHQPRHNIRFRDDKTYPELVVTTSEEVPRARLSRGRTSPGDTRFGPYVSSRDARETLNLLLPVFPVRTCSSAEYARAERSGRACLLHHIGRCLAPCIGSVSVAEHRKAVDGLAAFLKGDTDSTIRSLEQRMKEASAAQNYEAAARLRDQLEAARRTAQQQQVVWDSDVTLDALAIHEDDVGAAAYLIVVRRGRIVGQKAIILDKATGATGGELVAACLLRAYHDRSEQIPPLVLIDREAEDREAVEDLLTGMRTGIRRHAGRAGRVQLKVAKRGRRREIMDLAERNARQSLRRARLERAGDLGSRTAALEQLQKHLHLPLPPMRIECFDISHLGGTEVVGSMVAFEDGLPRPGDYRRYKLKQDRNDDPASIREIVRRRFLNLDQRRDSSRPERHESAAGAGSSGKSSERSGGAPWPQLVIIDGGPVQLEAALQAIEDLDLEGRVHRGQLALVGLAKRLEELWLPGADTPIMLPAGSDELHLVQRIRDEAHRTAISYQRKRRKGAIRSDLEDIPGIGPARRAELLRRFGSAAGIAAADDDELLAVKGITPAIVAALRQAREARPARGEGAGRREAA